MKYCAGIVICCLCLLGGVAPTGAATVDGIAAVVNGEVITYYEFNRLLNAFVSGLPKTVSAEERDSAIREAKDGLLNKLIDESLVTQEATRFGIVVRDDELNANIQEIMKKNKLSLEQFKEVLQKEGSSYEAYRKDLREHLMKMRVAAREIGSKVSVSDDEIGDYYAKNREVYEGKEMVKIRQIFFPVPAEAKEAVRQKLSDLADTASKKLKAGKSFEEVMDENLPLGAEVPAGGDTGFIEKGVMMPEVDRVAFDLKVGEISPVIASSAGFHIIQVVDKQGAGLKPLKAVREEINEMLFREKLNTKMKEWVSELRKKAFIDIKVK